MERRGVTDADWQALLIKTADKPSFRSLTLAFGWLARRRTVPSLEPLPIVTTCLGCPKSHMPSTFALTSRFNAPSSNTLSKASGP
jgi:hypothetical protein